MRFLDAIIREKQNNKVVIIPDIKCYSPKEGDLLQGRNPVEVATALVKAGAPVLSVVTEEKEFHGSKELLKAIYQAVKVPILRKDFIHTRKDLQETKECGATAILLMCSCLEPDELRFLYKEAIRLGLDPLVEIHNKEEMDLAKSLGAKLIGINNRNILELEKDDGTVLTTCQLAMYGPKDAVLISESSITSRREVIEAVRAGADCALIGTAIWKSTNPAEFYKSLIDIDVSEQEMLLKVCGLMNRKDVKMAIEQEVDILGFVVEYPRKVPWNLTGKQAEKLIEYAKEQTKQIENKNYKIPPRRRQKNCHTCIVTGGSSDKIIQLVKALKPDIVQLQYKETMEETAILTKALHQMGIQIIKAVPLQDSLREEQFGTVGWEPIIDSLCEMKIDGILIDSRNISHAEQSGEVMNLQIPMKIKKQLKVWEQSKDVNKYPAPKLVIAGGICPENAAAIAAKIHPHMLDVMSGVEQQPGIKDKEKLQKLIESIRGFHNQIL